jgi:hypothetical protein
MANDLIFHKFNLPLVHYPLNSILEIFATVQLNGLKSPHDIQILFGLYHLENIGCMGFNELEVTSLESSRFC